KEGAAAVREAKGEQADAETGGTAAPTKAKTPEDAEKEILDRYSKDIPADRQKVSGAKATEYQSDADFQAGMKSRHPGIEKKYDLKTINGESHQGKIYINKDRANPGTMYHEQIHHYSSPEFKSEF